MDSIIIVGMKHSGKSSLGKGLATNLSIPFFDTDAIIEEQTKLPVRQLFVEKGESAFKNAEVESCKFLEKKITHFLHFFLRYFPQNRLNRSLIVGYTIELIF